MKPTKATVEARVLEIVRIRLDGAEIWDIREYVREAEQTEGSNWHLPEGAKPLSDSQLWRYIAKADKAVAESCRASRSKLLRRHLAQRRNLYAKAVSQGDVKAALAVLKDEATLRGLYDLPPRPAKLPPATDARSLTAFLAEVIAQAGQGKLDAKTAGTLGGLSGALIRAIETGDLTARIEALEVAAKLKEPNHYEPAHPHQSAGTTAGPDGADDPAGHDG